MDKQGTLKTGSCNNVMKVIDSKKTVYKNLLIVGFIQLLSFAAISPTGSLMTTSAGKMLGNVTFALNHIFSCLFSFFAISLLDKETSTKMVILLGNACIVGFTACNWYISYYTLIPGTLLFGIGLSTSWIASMMYAKKLSVNYTTKHNLNEQHITSLFTGIILGFSVAGYTLGNATTSSVLMLLKPHDSENDTAKELNGSEHYNNKHCHTNDEQLEFDFITINVLRGLIVFYSLLGFVIVLVFLDNLEKKGLQIACNIRSVVFNFIRNVCHNAVAVAKVLATKELIMSCPLFITSGASLSFVYTIYTKVS